MAKQLALMSVLSVQPVFAFLFWWSTDLLFGALGVVGTTRNVVVFTVTAALYLVFCFFFARGFLSSREAQKIGF